MQPLSNTPSRQQIRLNRERMRNKVKSLSLRSKLKTEQDRNNAQETVLGSVCKSAYSSRSFEALFTLSDKIGEGAHGIVRKCIEKATGTLYCVKITQGDEEYIRISQKTYNLLFLVDSPHVIRPKNLFISSQSDTIYLVMEYVQYPSLHKLMQQGTLTPRQIHKVVPGDIAQVVRTLLQAVCDLHRVGVCHRDLKPENIMFDPESGTLKLIDFGVSKLIYNRKKQTKEKMWTVTGTIQYKAPEMFQGKEYDELVDSWAVGVITYQLIYGRMPFHSEFLAELIQQILEVQPDYPETELPQATLAADFIRSLLRKDSRRSTCLQALHHPWLSLLESDAPRTRIASEDFLNKQMQFQRYRQMSVKFNGTLSPPASSGNLEQSSLASDVDSLHLSEKLQ